MASKHATKKQKVSSKQKKKAVATTARPNIIPDPFAIENDSDKDDEERTLEEALFGKPFTPRGFKNAAKGKQVDRLAIVSDQPSLDHVLDDEVRVALHIYIFTRHERFLFGSSSFSMILPVYMEAIYHRSSVLFLKIAG